MSRVSHAMLLSTGLVCLALSFACRAGEPSVPGFVPEPPVGGANSPPIADPPRPVVETTELSANGFSVKVPTGEYVAPPGGVETFRIPGPIAAFKGPDGRWRGHSYLETTYRLESFTGRVSEGTAQLEYRFERGKRYTVTVRADGGAVTIDERSDLGPKNLWVLDCTYHWRPGAGFAMNLPATRHAFLYLPCYYDKPEATVNPVADLRADQADRRAVVGGLAVLHASDDRRDVLGMWCRHVDRWQGGETMGMQLWQRRQLPGDPASRHFLGPETKSDSTPNPRTAGMLGRSLYEGHVTIELNLGVGTRKLGLAVVGKGRPRERIPDPLESLIRRRQAGKEDE